MRADRRMHQEICQSSRVRVPGYRDLGKLPARGRERVGTVDDLEAGTREQVVVLLLPGKQRRVAVCLDQPSSREPVAAARGLCGARETVPAK